jgi:hypothetical protein
MIRPGEHTQRKRLHRRMARPLLGIDDPGPLAPIVRVRLTAEDRARIRAARDAAARKKLAATERQERRGRPPATRVE